MKRRLPVPVISFFLSLAAFLLFLLLYGVLGSGNRTILRGDLYVQYVDFIRMFLRVLKGEEDFWYSFSIYYGSGTILTYAYYVFSPFNLLYLIEAVPVPVMTICIISIKIALSGAFFSLFARRVLGCNAPISLFFSLCYAMNGFAVSFHLNIIWLDAIFMLPVVMMLLFRLADTGRYLSLVPAWVYLFITNFYMAYMVGIFSALVFICLLICRMPAFDASGLKQAAKRLSGLVISVALAAGISAVILLPCAMFLISHMAEDNIAFSALATAIPDMLNSLFVGSMPDLDNHTPVMYCGLPVLLCLPFYFSSGEISFKEKLLSSALLVFYILGMLYLPLFMALHAFDYPNYYFFRYSFCVSFLLCSLCCRRISAGIQNISPRHLLIWGAFLITFYSFMTGLAPLTALSYHSVNDSSLLAVNLLFTALWCLIFFLLRLDRQRYRRIHILTLLSAFLILICELAVNGQISMLHTDMTPLSEAEYDSWYDAESTALSGLKEDKGLYRVIMRGESSYNAPSFFGYNGFNTFSSSDDYSMRTALYDLGISGTNRSITENGYTDLTYLLFSAAYEASILHPDASSAERESVLRKLPYSLPIAYMVSDSIRDYSPGEDPFENQEKLVYAMTGNRYRFFDRLRLEDISISSYNAGIRTVDEHHIFYKKTDLYPSAAVYFSVPKKEGRPFLLCFRQKDPIADATAPHILCAVDGCDVTTTLSYGCIYYGGNPNGSFSDDSETLAVFFDGQSRQDYPCKGMYFSRFDPTELSSLHRDLAPGGLDITAHHGGHIKGTVTVPSDKTTLFTSIPMDEGWHATVDGIAVSCEPILGDAFLSLSLTPGTHEITLDYTAPGAEAGAVITLLSLMLYLLLAVFSRRSFYHKASAEDDKPDQ
ncbi:MAG: YfhO family protein [Lachnospiraceae bacterium]|nr:YfhO family protein [Lachnospiraceae bacterium]